MKERNRSKSASLSGDEFLDEEENLASCFIDAPTSRSNSNVNANSEMEEEMEDDGAHDILDFLLHYIIKVEIEAKWPELENTSCSYTLCYPLLQKNEPDDQPFFPYFMKPQLIKLSNFEYFADTVDVTLNMGKKVKTTLNLNQPQTFEFDYTPGKKESHRVGKVTLTYENYGFDFSKIPGRLVFNEVYKDLMKKKIINKERVIFDKISNLEEDDDDTIKDATFSKTRIFPWLIDEEGKIVVMNAGRDDEDDPNIRRRMFIPLYPGQNTHFVDNYISEEESYIEHIIDVEFEEN